LEKLQTTNRDSGGLVDGADKVEFRDDISKTGAKRVVFIKYININVSTYDTRSKV
jgi:hypothetical protein